MGSESIQDLAKWPALGVLGGMGTFASLKFAEEFYSLFHDLPDHKRPRIVLDVDTSIPSRGRHILYGEKSPVPEILNALEDLSEIGADVLTLVCNSAATLLRLEEIQLKDNFVNIIDATSLAIPSSKIEFEPCLVIGGQVTFRLSPYRKPLEEKGFRQVELSNHDQSMIESHIEDVKKFGFRLASQEALHHMLIKFQEHYHAGLIILACTELDFMGDNLLGIQVINSRIELASHIFNKCYQGQR
jgi:aspartate racemase